MAVWIPRRGDVERGSLAPCGAGAPTLGQFTPCSVVSCWPSFVCVCVKSKVVFVVLIWSLVEGHVGCFRESSGAINVGVQESVPNLGMYGCSWFGCFSGLVLS